jgi:hypothetical protein
MKSSATKTYRKQLGGLPASVQEQATKAYTLWQADPYHPSLQFKRVSKTTNLLRSGQCLAGACPILSIRLKDILAIG